MERAVNLFGLEKDPTPSLNYKQPEFERGARCLNFWFISALKLHISSLFLETF